jgi:anti-sigma28 factor (negative regulator of flagellin synthesis)
MENRYFYKALVAGVAMFSLPLASFALTVGQTTKVDAGVNVNASSTTNASSNANLNAGVNSTTSVEGESRSGASSSSSTGTARLETNSSGIEILLPTQVNTEEDLNVYQKNTIANDKKVAEIDTDIENGVAVEYKHPGKLFGVINVEVNSKTTVEAGSDGKLKTETTFPWWSAMVRGLGDIRAQVDGTIKSQFANVMTNGTTEAVLKARLIDAIIEAHANVKTDAEVDTANTNADGSTTVNGILKGSVQ